MSSINCIVNHIWLTWNLTYIRDKENVYSNNKIFQNINPIKNIKSCNINKKLHYLGIYLI